jgi:hypothetical protein
VVFPRNGRKESELFKVKFRQRCPIVKKFLICNKRIETAKKLANLRFSDLTTKNIADLQFADWQLAYRRNLQICDSRMCPRLCGFADLQSVGD